MRTLLGILGWMVAAVGVLSLIVSGLCGVLGLASEPAMLGVALVSALIAYVVFWLGRALYRWGFRPKPPLDRSQGQEDGAPPSSAA